jgi:DNA-binding MarR family transcriptional regulator
MGSIQVLLLIAETPAQPVSWLAQEMQMSVSGVQRVLLNLSAVDRFGRPGPALVEQISDPLHSNRKLLFLTGKGRALVNDAVAVLSDRQGAPVSILTADDYIKQHEKADDGRRGIFLNAYTPQQVATAKRSLRRKSIEVGRHVIAFPLQPAQPFIPEIRTWLDERGGALWELEDVGKPDGMALAELPNSDEEFAFVVTFRQPT